MADLDSAHTLSSCHPRKEPTLSLFICLLLLVFVLFLFCFVHLFQQRGRAISQRLVLPFPGMDWQRCLLLNRKSLSKNNNDDNDNNNNNNNYCPTSNCSVLSPSTISSCPQCLITRNRGERGFLRHTGTKVRGGAAQAKSVNMKTRQKQRWK